MSPMCPECGVLPLCQEGQSRSGAAEPRRSSVHTQRCLGGRTPADGSLSALKQRSSQRCVGSSSNRKRAKAGPSNPGAVRIEYGDPWGTDHEPVASLLCCRVRAFGAVWVTLRRSSQARSSSWSREVAQASDGALDTRAFEFSAWVNGYG